MISKVKPRVDLAAYTKVVNQLARKYISIDFKPVSFDEDITLREDLFLTPGVAYLKYLRGRAHGYFKFICFEKRLHIVTKPPIYSYSHFLEMCGRYKEFEFLRKVTGISEDHFRLAAYNYGVYITLGYDLLKYQELCGGKTSFTTRAIMALAAQERLEIREGRNQPQTLNNGTSMNVNEEEPGLSEEDKRKDPCLDLFDENGVCIRKCVGRYKRSYERLAAEDYQKEKDAFDGRDYDLSECVRYMIKMPTNKTEADYPDVKSPDGRCIRKAVGRVIYYGPAAVLIDKRIKEEERK